MTAEVDGIMLRWARSVIRMSPEVAARKLRMDVARLRSWEEGTRRPTVRQLRKLAKLYGQPFAAFYLPKPPGDYTPDVHDYRRPVGTAALDISTELILELRTANERRLTAVELLMASGEEVPIFALRTDLEANPEFAGLSIRSALEVTPEMQAEFDGGHKALAEWRSRVESLGVLVFQSSSLPFPTVRGFSVTADRLPVITLNRKDTPEARVFTLIHELTHLMLHAAGVCDLRSDVTLPPEDQRVEVFCNAVAGATLVPRHWFVQALEAYPQGERDWSDAELRSLATTFSVSREVILRRLLSFGRTSLAAYRRFRTEERQRPPSRKRSGPVPPSRDTLSKVGRPYVGAVLGARSRGIITTADASGYLGLKVKHFQRLAELAGS